MGVAPSVPQDRTQSLKVIGAGYSRTGTLSMALALGKLLDGPVMHGGSQLLGREDAYVKLWSDIFDARRDKPRLMKLLREATAGFVAITDGPGTSFVPELLELYPDAEVVCVYRNPARWWKSFQLLEQRGGAGFLNWFLLPVPGKRWFPKIVTQWFDMQDERWGPISERRLEQHNSYIKESIPPAKFHVMELSEGWAPLCKILGTPAPDEPFPRANDADAMEGVASKILLEVGLRWSGIFAVMGMLGYSALWLWRARRLL